jgi:lysozyme family protein
MANFEEAYYLTLGHEGGYANDPTDAGGETYMGISRVYNPSWYGWGIIDEAKGDNFPSCLDNDEELQDAVEDFYKDKYWDVNLLDQFPQAVSNEMFDTGVNMGISRAAKFLQTALNYLNRNGSLFSDLVVDGKIGPATLRAFNTVEKDADIIVKMLNTLQGNHYMEYMSKSPTQEKYARGWFKRVSYCDCGSKV